MNTIKTTVGRYPLMAFFVLSFALSWWPWPVYIYGLSPAPVIGFGPFLAALMVLALTAERQGVKDLLGRMVLWWAAAYVLLLISGHELGRRRSAPGAGDPASYYRGVEK